MLESILSPGTAERDPWDMVALGFIIASLSLFAGFLLSEYVPAEPSMLALALTVMALAPLLYRIEVIEEEKEECDHHHSAVCLITRHMGAIGTYSFLFVGLLAAFSFWYVVLPHDSNWISSSEMFSIQESAVTNLQQQISGKATEGLSPQPTANADAIREQYFTRLFNNNVRVMLICFAASVLFGAGALWLLAWNASTIGVAIGYMIKLKLSSMSPLEAYAVGFPMYSLGLALWAIPEVLAYLVAALAGGIVSVAVAKHHLKSEKFWLTIFDAGLYMLFAIFLVFLGAYIEHFFVKV